MPHARRQKVRTTSALGSFAAREARAAIEAPSCASAVDRLGMAAFFAGQAVASDRKRGGGKKSNVVALLKKARAHVADACARGGPIGGRGSGPGSSPRHKTKRKKWKGYNK